MLTYIMRVNKTSTLRKTQLTRQLAVAPPEAQVALLKQKLQKPNAARESFLKDASEEDYYVDDDGPEDYDDYYADKNTDDGYLRNLPFGTWFGKEENAKFDVTQSQLDEALERIMQLEGKLQGVELNFNKQYPKITILNTGEKKRILVRIFLLFSRY